MARNPFDSAVQKGRDAFLAGKPRTACPYKDKRKDDGRLTFSRAWQIAWRDGYDLAFRQAINAVLGGERVTIGSCVITLDGPYLCATDPYGCDHYLGEPTEDSVRKAIVWAIAEESAPIGNHPAERNSTGGSV